MKQQNDNQTQIAPSTADKVVIDHRKGMKSEYWYQKETRTGEPDKILNKP